MPPIAPSSSRTRAEAINRRVVSRLSKLNGSLFTAEEGEDASGVVLGIDASLTSFGLSAVGIESGRHATMLFKPKLKGVARLDEIYEFVKDTVWYVDRYFGVQHVTLENYAMGIKGGRTFSIGEGGGAVKLALLHHFGNDQQVAYPTLVSPSALKKFVLGKGTGKKNEMLLGIYRKWEMEFSSDDMGDSFSLAKIAISLLTGTTDYAYEEDVIQSLERHTEWNGE